MRKSKKFQRRVENFICRHCGMAVTGNGYTDHCPVCLIGMHIDLHPGDRSAGCGGKMIPIDYEVKGKNIKIKYQCKKCDHIFWVKKSPNDNIEALLRIKN